MQHLGARVALFVFALGTVAYREAVMDDTFIHLQYARNLAELGELSFNPGEPSLGMTSPLWILLLAISGYSLMAAKLWSVAAGALSVVIFWRLALRLLGTGAFAIGATAAWGGALWLVRHAPNGMESTLATCLVLAAIELRSRGGRSTGRDLLFGVVLGALALTRPELVALALVFFVVDIRSRWGRSRLALWFPVMLCMGAAWFAFSLWKTGMWLPATGTAKSAGFDWAPALWLNVLWREARIIGAGHAIEVLGVLLGVGWLLRRRQDAAGWRQHPLVPYAAFSLLLASAFVVLDLQVQPRYLLPVMPLVTLLGFLAWRHVLGARTSVALVVCLLSLFGSATISKMRVLPVTVNFSRSLQSALLPMISIIDSRGGARSVACPDIGVMGYLGRFRVVDLGGLIDARAQTWTKDVGYDAMLSEGLFLDIGPVDYVIDRSITPQRFADHQCRGLRWVPLETTMLDNLGLSRPGPFYYTLYALEPVVSH